MADQRTSNTGCASSCGIVFVMVALFWLGTSAYFGYTNTLNHPIEEVPDIGSFVWYFCVSFMMGPFVLFFTPVGWIAFAVVFGMWLVLWMYFDERSQSFNAVREAGVPNHSETSPKNVPISLIMILGVAVVWFTVWCVTRDPWWFINGRDALR